MSFKIGQLVKLSARRAAGESGRSILAIVVAESGRASGANPHETLEIVPASRADLNLSAHANCVQVDWQSVDSDLASCQLTVDCGLVRPIPSSWVTHQYGSLPAESVDVIDRALRLFL